MSFGSKNSKPSSGELESIIWDVLQMNGEIVETSTIVNQAKTALRQYIDKEVLKGRIDELKLAKKQGAMVISGFHTEHIEGNYVRARLKELKKENS